MPLNPLNHHYSLENPATIYDEEAMTALQLAGRTTAKVNETVEAFNRLEAETNIHLEQQDASIPVKIADKVQEHITGGQFDKQIDKYAGELEAQVSGVERSLSARMDTFTKLQEGSTTGDAELQDARVSDLGHVHANAGDSIRTNVALLREATAPAFVKEKGLYSLFEHKYVNGVVNTYKDTLCVHPPVKFDSFVTIKPLKGYEISTQRWTDEGGTQAQAYTEWTTGPTLFRPGSYYSICIRHGRNVITLDEAYAVQFIEPFYSGEVYGNALDTIYPLMHLGGFSLDAPGLYDETHKNAMFSKGGFVLPEATVLHCEGEASVALHTYSDNTISAATRTGDSGWQKELIIPANTFGVLYFRKSPERPDMVLDDLKLLKSGHSINVATDKGNINRSYMVPIRKGIAHRGYSYYGVYAPENTLPAFRLAKANGFDYVECDVRISSDGVPVICHDLTVDRTSDGAGYVHQMTVEQLKALDFSVECDVPKYKGTKMPTLEETLITCKNLGVHLYLEVEPQCENYEGTIVNLVKKYGMENGVTYISFSHAVLTNISKLDASTALGFIVDTPDETSLSSVIALRTGYNDVFLDARYVATDVMEMCKASGVPVELWCYDDITEMQNFDPYVRGVTSEYTNYKTVMYEMEMEGI